MNLTQTSISKMVQVLTHICTVLPGYLCLQDSVGLKDMRSVKVIAIIETRLGFVEKGERVSDWGSEHLGCDSRFKVN